MAALDEGERTLCTPSNWARQAVARRATVPVVHAPRVSSARLSTLNLVLMSN